VPRPHGGWRASLRTERQGLCAELLHRLLPRLPRTQPLTPGQFLREFVEALKELADTRFYEPRSTDRVQLALADAYPVPSGFIQELSEHLEYLISPPMQEPQSRTTADLQLRLLGREQGNEAAPGSWDEICLIADRVIQGTTECLPPAPNDMDRAWHVYEVQPIGHDEVPQLISGMEFRFRRDHDRGRDFQKAQNLP